MLIKTDRSFFQSKLSQHIFCWNYKKNNINKLSINRYLHIKTAVLCKTKQYFDEIQLFRLRKSRYNLSEELLSIPSTQDYRL